MSSEYREKAVVFGSEQNLVGIVCSRGSTAGPSTPGVIILNAGVVHRVGPGRLGVRLSRELGGAGTISLRFDLSGIGDSLARRDTLSLEECVVKDVEEAMAYLEEAHGVERFVFVGLCSGAREAFRTAHRDERVVGAVMIDPIVFRTRRFYMQHYGRKVASTEVWRNALTGGTRYLGRVRADLLDGLRSDVARGEAPEV
ncbi:MAG: hypothetical protein R3344_12810, partial [Acidobacteriota bacterium]|nr:hypothetical protein [Acidobacteriota bacterium]